MTIEIRRVEDKRPVATSAAQPALDYYLIFPERRDVESSAQPDGIAVEEFILADDYTAIGLANAVWTAAEGDWWSSAAFSKEIRADPRLRARIVPVRRDEAEAAYRRLAADALPNETTLRAHFHDYASLATSPPLRLTPVEIPDGFREKRVYRIFFADTLQTDQLAHLQQAWDMTFTDDVAGQQAARVLGTARLHVADDMFVWDLRQIGPGIASSIDLTAFLAADPAGATLRTLLRELMATVRYAGLIPVTIERLS